MPDAAEVSIESALLDHLRALTFVPALQIAWPNVLFVPPVVGPNVTWLRPTFLPADTITLTVNFDASNQHFGLLQIDIFTGQGGGELAPARIATDIIAWFKRGTRLTKNGFVIDVNNAPFRRNMTRNDPWMALPVFVPYLCFAVDPA